MISLVGILNRSPDSFSDGKNVGSIEESVQFARKMIADGATLIDVGGDSTGPKSNCIGVEEEWRRIAPIFEQLRGTVDLSVDTHHAEVAARAISLGATIVNDISAGFDPAMFNVIAQSDVRYVAMYSTSGVPHSFGNGNNAAEIVARVQLWFEHFIVRATSAGVRKSQLIFDTGMGAFLGDNSKNSWDLICNYARFTAFGCPLFFGCSRKGFLKLDGEGPTSERDPLSAFCGAAIAAKVGAMVPLYLRVHNVKMQRMFLEASGKLGIL